MQTCSYFTSCVRLFNTTCITTRSLQWRHNEHDGVSNHQPHDCLLNRFFRRRSKKTPKLHLIGLCAGNSPVTGEVPAQRASDAENVSIWWRHHVYKAFNKRVFFDETPQLLGIVFPQRISPTANAAWCHWRFIYGDYIDGLVQESRNSSALAMELRLSCINSSILALKQRIMGTTFAFVF